MKRILILTAKQGHFSIASSVSSGLITHHYQTKVIDLSKQEFTIYKILYRYAPSLISICLFIANLRLTQFFYGIVFRRRYYSQIDQIIQSFKPNLIISTWYGYNPAISSLSGLYQIPFLNIITDPRANILVGFAPNHENLVFDSTTTKYYTKHSRPPTHFFPVGWFVRPQFKPTTDISQTRKKLHLPVNNFTILVVGGSDGTTSILKIIPSLLKKRSPLNIIIICGHHQLLYNSLKRLFSQFKSSIHTIILKPYAHDLHQHMQAADLILGKAGPNIIFESAACHKPFLAITHVGKHEKDNLRLINEYHLGFIAENPITAHRLIKRIINNPSELKQFDSHLHKLAIYNQNSLARLLKLINQLI
jgi:UDP-N-acetylglucosamine:LPS N-acetylglucosamine transferase